MNSTIVLIRVICIENEAVSFVLKHTMWLGAICVDYCVCSDVISGTLLRLTCLSCQHSGSATFTRQFALLIAYACLSGIIYLIYKILCSYVSHEWTVDPATLFEHRRLWNNFSFCDRLRNSKWKVDEICVSRMLLITLAQRTKFPNYIMKHVYVKK